MDTVSNMSDKFSAMASNIKHLKPKVVEKLSFEDDPKCRMNHPANSGRQNKSGWLRKQGGMVKSWHRRWFVLNGECLFYFAKEDDLKPLGTIYLPGNKVIQHPINPEDPEKFLMEIVPGKVPVKMAPNHETFLLCAASDDERQEWLKSIRKTMFASIGGAIFGSRLEETMEFEKGRSKRKIPYIVDVCIDFLTAHALEVEGIFRLPGRMLLVRDLKDRFDEGEKVLLKQDDVDVHSVASLLKQYLRELPECLIPYKCYQEFMNIAMRFQDSKGVNNKDEQVKVLQKAMASLPQDNYNLMKHLCLFLHKVASNVAINKMTPLNLATVFGPNIIRHPQMDDNPEVFMLTTADISQQLAYMFINYTEQVFTMDFDDGRKSAVIAVDDLLSLNDDAFTPTSSGGILQPKSSDDLTNIVFEQRGDRRGRSFLPEQSDSKPVPEPRRSSKKGTPPPTTAPRPAHRESSTRNLNINLNSNAHVPYITSPQSAETSPVIHTQSLGMDNEGKPVPPLRRKYTRKGQLTQSKSFDSNSSELSGSSNSLNDDLADTSPSNNRDSITLNNNNVPNTEILELQQKLTTVTAEYSALKSRNDNLISSKAKSDDSVKKLSAELSKIQTRYEDHINNMEVRHKQQMQDMGRQLEEEKSSRSNVVQKVIDLQKVIHNYQMQYGDLNKRELPPLYQ